MRMLSVLRFTFTKEAKFVVAFIPFYSEPLPLIITPGIAWQSVQTLQLCPWGAFPRTLGRRTLSLRTRQIYTG